MDKLSTTIVDNSKNTARFVDKLSTTIVDNLKTPLALWITLSSLFILLRKNPQLQLVCVDSVDKLSTQNVDKSSAISYCVKMP
ncbi:hypothetical protein KSD_27320 [Ktedonobacter sp. SOSP1-85]|nr:hypothetical protein KSD_27320 [Ktedonobacter sp. SOSP1-85]